MVDRGDSKKPDTYDLPSSQQSETEATTTCHSEVQGHKEERDVIHQHFKGDT